MKVSLCSEIEPTFPCHIQLINNPIISVAMAHVSPLLVIVMQLEELSESLLAELEQVNYKIQLELSFVLKRYCNSPDEC